MKRMQWLRMMMLLVVGLSAQGNAQLVDEFNDQTIDVAKWNVTTQDYGENVGTIALDGTGNLIVNVTGSVPGQPRSQTFIRSIGTLPATWTNYSRIKFESTAVDRNDLKVGFYFEMNDGTQAFVLFDSRMGMRMSYGDATDSHDGPVLLARNWYELKFTYDGVEIRAWYREAGRTDWLGNFAVSTSWTATPLRLRLGQSGTSNPISFSDVTHTVTMDYYRSTGETPAVEALTEDDFAYSTLNPTLWRRNQRDYSGNVGVIGPDGDHKLVASVTSDLPGVPLAQTFVETLRRLPNLPWTNYTRLQFSSTALDRADTHVGVYFLLSDGTEAFLLFDSRTGMSFRYGNSSAIQDGPALYPNVWYEWKFIYNGLDLRAWYREAGKTVWQGNYPLHTSFTAYPERIRIGQCTLATPASFSDVTHTLQIDYWRLSGDNPAPVGIVSDEFNLSQVNPSLWIEHEQDFSDNTGTITLNANGNLVISTTGGSPGPPCSQTYLRTQTRLRNAPWSYLSRFQFNASATGRSDLPLGFYFTLSSSNYAFFALDSRNGMTLRYGSDAIAADGVALTPNFWYELKIEYNGTDIYAWYREDGSTVWLGNYRLTQSVTGTPEFLYVGQMKITSPVSFSDITHTLTIDYLRGTSETPSFRFLSAERQPSTTLRMNWEAAAGWRFQLQATDNVAGGIWTNIYSEITATNQNCTWGDPISITTPKKFYRLMLIE